MHPWARAALCARLRAGGCTVWLCACVRACVPSGCGRRARLRGAECAREAELSDAVLTWGNGSFTPFLRFCLRAPVSRLRPFPCPMHSRLFCLASLSHLPLARPACPSGISAAHPTWTAPARKLPAFPLTASTARYVPHGLYPEHYRTLAPPVRSVMPKLPLLCVCATPLSSDAIHRAHSAPRVAGRGRR
jgi:hypothetical protein